MLKKVTQKAKGAVTKFKKTATALSVATVASAYAAGPMFAADTSDLGTVTAKLVDGGTEIKTNGMTIVVAVIAILVIFFGIGWLIAVFRKNMNKAN